jgi:hypothetical protein
MSGVVGLGLLVTTLSSCSLTFDVKASGEGKVEGSALGQFFEALPFKGFDNFASFDISQTQDFKNQGVDKEHLESVKLKTLTLKVTDPSSANFNFIDKIAFYAATEGKPKVRIAHKDAVPRDSREFSLDLDGAELKDYVSAKSMKITTEASGRSPAQDTTIHVDVVFTVDPQL